MPAKCKKCPREAGMSVEKTDCYPPDNSIESPVLIAAAPDEALVGPLCGEVVFLHQSLQGQPLNCLLVYNLLLLLRLKIEIG